MQKTARSLGDTPTWSADQLARVPRLIRLITEIKTNPRQTPAQLYRTLGISRSRYFQDKTLLERAFGFKVQFNHLIITYEHYDQDALWRHTIDPYQLFFRRRALLPGCVR
jgi:hypothetical protein